MNIWDRAHALGDTHRKERVMRAEVMAHLYGSARQRIQMDILWQSYMEAL